MSPQVLIFAASSVVVFLTSVFTDRGSPFRYLSLLTLFWLSCILPRSFSTYSDARGFTGGIPAGAAFWNAIMVFDRLILRGWDFSTYSQRTSEESEKRGKGLRNVKTRMDFGLVFGEARGIDTFWEVKNVPRFSAGVPERTPFICWQVVSAVACYFAHNWAISNILSLNMELLNASHIPFLSRLSTITTDELYARATATYSFWLAQWAMMQFVYSLASALGAIGNAQDIKLFRPLFGSPVYAYSVRNAWGKSWHQSMRSGLEGTSGFLAHDILRLPRRGLLQRYSKILFSFAISGIMHLVADAGGGVPMHKSGALQFFIVQALGIIVEDAVQAVWLRMLGSGTALGSSQVIGKVVGYAWVAAFVIWSSPVWIYPIISGMGEDNAKLGLASVKLLLFPRRPE